MRQWLRRTGAIVVAGIGYVLSPLSWWNDLYVNIPIAYFAASSVPLNHPRAFAAVFAATYWLTNVLGLVLLQTGGASALERNVPGFRRHRISTWLAWSLLYTLAIVLLCELGVIRPLPEILPQR